MSGRASGTRPSRARRSTRRRSATARHLLQRWRTTCPAAACPVRRSRIARPGPPRSAAGPGAASHHHGGAINHTLPAQTCIASCLTPRPTTAPPTPVQHDPPDPARARPDRQRHVPLRQGVPVAPGRCSSAPRSTTTRTLHVAAMGFWVLLLARGDGHQCEPMPSDLSEVTGAREVRRAAPFVFQPVVPQLASRGALRRSMAAGASATSTSGPRVQAQVGAAVTWRFTGMSRTA